MSRSYVWAAAIDKTIQEHLKALGFNIQKPPIAMTVKHKISVLNYLRTIKTTVDIVGETVNNTPTGEIE